MSLMRLLTVGRSLNELKGAGRYHIPRGVGLPQFNFGKPAMKISSAPAVKAAAGEVQATPATVEKNTTVAVAGEVRKPASGGWLKRSNPFAATQPAAVKAPMQAELTLDKVKVVRNDLSEADFEVVPKKELPRQSELKPYRKPNRPASVPDDDVLGAKAWNWLGSRLFGAAAKQ